MLVSIAQYHRTRTGREGRREGQCRSSAMYSFIGGALLVLQQVTRTALEKNYRELSAIQNQAQVSSRIRFMVLDLMETRKVTYRDSVMT